MHATHRTEAWARQPQLARSVRARRRKAAVCYGYMMPRVPQWATAYSEYGRAVAPTGIVSMARIVAHARRQGGSVAG